MAGKKEVSAQKVGQQFIPEYYGALQDSRKKRLFSFYEVRPRNFMESTADAAAPIGSVLLALIPNSVFFTATARGVRSLLLWR